MKLTVSLQIRLYSNHRYCAIRANASLVPARPRNDLAVELKELQNLKITRKHRYSPRVADHDAFPNLKKTANPKVAHGQCPLDPVAVQ